MLLTGLLVASIASAAIGAAGALGAQALTNDSIKATNAENKAINETNNAFNAEQADLNRQFQAEEAQKQRDYETEMSNTAIQRRASDLEAAGFNPALAVTSGSASTPGAVAATGSQAHNAGLIPMKAMDYSPMAQLSAGLSHAVNSAKDIAFLQQMANRNPSVIRYLDAATSAVNRTNSAQSFARKSHVIKSISKESLLKDLRSAGVKI